MNKRINECLKISISRLKKRKKILIIWTIILSPFIYNYFVQFPNVFEYMYACYRVTSFGNDDFIADMDSANIIHLMRDRELSFMQAQQRYYNMLGAGETTRSTFFVNNVVDIETVRREIFRELEPNLIQEFARQENRPIGLMGLRTIIDFLANEEAIMLSLREIAPDTYNFIRTLEYGEGLNEMKIVAGSNE